MEREMEQINVLYYHMNPGKIIPDSQEVRDYLQGELLEFSDYYSTDDSHTINHMVAKYNRREVIT